ncbi:Sad1 / UNC-like protein [Teladorsagia circumcincta]|uniref:Sad1 / UNC-like protein n=1 Tax=Teladorsagia circumcincta TaxID=45464 RepID=A0A2G9V4X6_TELCI|nr:Sad1 / UNC-like protein [Teladorsagia circumcincta]
MSSAASLPSLEEMYRRRPSFDRPPIRALDSPRLTAEEADQLTSPFLQAYNPDKPPAWEVPNMINNNLLSIASPEYDPYHFSAPSLLRKTWQAGSSAVWFLISSVFWLLHSVTVRPVKAVGMLIYDCVDWTVYKASRIGEWISGSAYKRRDYKLNRAYAGSPSTIQMISMLMWKFLYFLGRVVRAPVDLVSGSFRSFYLALSRMYHAVLAKKSRQVIRENAMKKTYEPSHLSFQSSSKYNPSSKYQNTREEEYDSDFIDDEEEEPEGPVPTRGHSPEYHQRQYYLRSRAMHADDSEDDTPRMRKNVRFDMASSVRDLTSFVIDFFANTGHNTYGKLPSVRAKMDQDLKIKLEKELKALTASYEQKLSNLKVEKHRTDIDYAHLESLIRSAIYEYDSDKTGMFDFALESAGASIISTRCSENYDTYTRLEKIWNIPLWYSSYGPRTVIQRNSKTLFPGECWSFKGPVGYITIGLSHPINVTIVSYEHIGAHQAPGGERPSAPKTFKIWAYKSESDMSSRVLLGDFMYDIKGSPLQFFVIKTQPDYPVQIIEMEVTSNYGAEYTSLYRLRVHGSLYKPGQE